LIGVVTDSAASIAAHLLDGSAIVTVPMQLEVDGRPVGEAGLDVDEVVDALIAGRGAELHTSAPSPGAFLEAIEQADQGEGVVVLTVSSKMSSSYEAAVLAARMSGAQVQVVDTGTAAGAQGLVALAAAAEARSGGSLEAVVKQANTASNRVRLVGAVGDLRQLARSGRLPSSVAKLGNAFGLHPVFLYKRAQVRVLRPARSEAAAREALVSAFRSTLEKGGHRLHVAANYATDLAGAEWLLEEVAEHAEPATSYVARFGPVMVAHTGTDILGLSWWWEPTC